MGVFVFCILGLLTVNAYQAYQKQLQYQSMVLAARVKQNALKTFVSKIALDVNNKDWANLYDSGMTTSFKNLVTKDVFIKTSDKSSTNIYSFNMTAKNVSIKGNNGTVEEVYLKCITRDCIGDNRQESTNSYEFTYDNGGWSPKDKIPWEKALADASYIYAHYPTNSQDFIDKFGDGYNSAPYAINNLALVFDFSPANLALGDATVEKLKASKEAQSIIPMPTTYNPPVVTQQQQPQTYHYVPQVETVPLPVYTPQFTAPQPIPQMQMPNWVFPPVQRPINTNCNSTGPNSFDCYQY